METPVILVAGFLMIALSTLVIVSRIKQRVSSLPRGFNRKYQSQHIGSELKP